tara:strand:+ start:174 stop:449 length:276 start_codon:yes stop_codon:yes gene_type:complete
MNEPFVPIEDVAKHFSVSISTVRAWVRQEHIPKSTYVKIGNTYRFRVGDVADALTTAEKNNSNGSVKTRDYPKDDEDDINHNSLESLDEDI